MSELLRLNRSRLPYLFIAVISLGVGLSTGLHRLGWDLSIAGTSMHHGAIMVGGFLGTLISFEKVIPLKSKYLLLIPLISGSSFVFFFAGLPLVAFICLVVASAGLSAVFIYYLLNERNVIYLLMLGGGLCWLVGNLMLISKSFYPLAFPWWSGFALFIITSERLELMKFLPVTEREKSFLGIFLAVYIVGVMLSFHGAGSFISGGASIGIATWLMRFDMASISITKSGLIRFVGISLLSSYVSMLLTGMLMVSLDNQPLSYDAVVHSFFVGFVFSMIFAHGPVIMPGLLGIATKPYHKVLYLWLILLHVSWMARVYGDVYLDLPIRKFSGIVTAFAILGYFATMVKLITAPGNRHAKLL